VPAHGGDTGGDTGFALRRLGTLVVMKSWPKRCVVQSAANVYDHKINIP
jgi:hypothetical protein